MNTQQKTSSVSAERLRDLLSLKGVPERSQANELARLLNVPFSAASRMLKGAVPILLEQVSTVAEHFQVDLSVFLEQEDTAGDPLPPNPQNAIFTVNESEFPALLWIGARIPPRSERPRCVAIESDNGWEVLEAASAPDVPQYFVEKLELSFQKANIPLVAVIDDDENLSSALAEYLSTHSMDARGFSDPQAFVDTLATTQWDGLVLDWTLGNDWDGQKVMAAVEQSSSKNAPLILLTGILTKGSAIESGQVAAALDEKANAIFLSKPLDIAIIASTLQQKIWAQKTV